MGVNSNSTTLVPLTGLTKDGGWFKNLSVVSHTTTDAGDSVKFTSGDGTPLSALNPAFVSLPDPSVAGNTVTFTVTSDVVILLTGAHWGLDTRGDTVGTILRALAINDNGTIKFAAVYLGGRHTLLTTDTDATPANITLPEYVLCNSAIGSATNSCRELTFWRSDFTDTGGAAEDLWTNQNGVSDFVMGENGDGIWQQWNPNPYTGFSADPAVTTERTRWCQIKRQIFLFYDITTAGTSDDTVFTMTAPAKCRFARVAGFFRAIDNGVVGTTPGTLITGSNSSTLSIRSDMVSTPWTPAGDKYIAMGNVYFEVGPAASFIE